VDPCPAIPLPSKAEVFQIQGEEDNEGTSQ